MANFLAIVLLFLISAFSCADSTNSSSQNCILTPDWHMFVINGLSNEVIIAHIRDEYGRPQCEHCPMSPGVSFSWYFCPFGEWYYGDFTRGSTQKTVQLYSKHIQNFCGHKFLLGTEHCYWLVKPDGFYVAKKNLSISDPNWSYESPWI
ncbi:putative plant self-incompatibility S1 [Helianthus anomalus]